MILESLELRPRGKNGWGSGTLKLGEFLTILHGPNGSGKTPLLKALLWGLGYPVELPEEITSHCQSVKLALQVGQEKVEVERALGVDTTATISRGRTKKELETERELSDAVLDVLGVPQRIFTGKQQQSASLYMSVFAPTFWVDQDLGWRATYVPPKNRNFIGDQEEEIHRFVFGLPEKRVFVDKGALSGQKDRVATLDERIRVKRAALEARTDEGEALSPEALVELEHQQSDLKAELERNSDGIEALRRSSTRLDAPIEAQMRVCSEIELRTSGLRRQLGQLRRVGEQIAGEGDVLGLNAVSADGFRTFCGMEGCRLFKNAEISYGRRLMYLKDQTKDLDASTRGLTAEIERLQAQVAKERKLVETLQAEQKRSVEAQGHVALASRVATLGQTLAGVELKLARARALDGDRIEFERLVKSRATEAEKLEAVKTRASKTGTWIAGRSVPALDSIT